jgi:2'-5' RNA ligase
VPKKYENINFTPPKDVQSAARRGLEMRKKYGRGGLSRGEASKQGIGSGVQRATNLANGDTVSPETIGRMVSFFARHEKNKDSKTDSGEPGAGQIAWLLWGGTPGQRWAKKVKRQMETANMKNKSLAALANTIITVRGVQVNKPQNGGILPTDSKLGLLSVCDQAHLAKSFVIPPPLTYKSETHTGAMIALFLPADVGRKFALSGGVLNPSEMHITLAYLGKVDQLTYEQKEECHNWLSLMAANHPPLTGTINGCGRFCNGDDEGDPFFIIPDLPDLPTLRQIVIDGLQAKDLAPARDHGFTPHITLTYIPHDSPNPFDQITRTPVTFPTISLVLAGDRYDYPFTSVSPLGKAALIERHLKGKHSQKQHAGKGSGKKGAESSKKKPKTATASSIFKELPANLGLVDSKKRTKVINQLSELSTGELERALAANNKKLETVTSDLDTRNALIQSKWLEQATKKRIKKLKTKAALIEKIGARHTGGEYATIQKMHNLTLELGAECHPLTRRAGARHSHADRGMVQRIHDDCVALGAECKALPAKDEVYSSQVMKEGPIIKAQSDAPNYKPASTPQRCKNCKFFRSDPGEDYCTLFDFTADQDYICDDWEAQRPDEIPGYVANKADLAALTKGILILRGGATSGNWGHAGRKGKRGGSGRGGGFGKIGVKPGSRRKTVLRKAAKKKGAAETKDKKPTAKPDTSKPPKPKVSKPKSEDKDQDFNQKDAKKFGWLSKEMESFEKDNAGAKIESGAVYSKSGKELFKVKGDENAVDFSEDQLKLMKGAVVTHNHPVVTGHPDGGSFSPSDISLMFNTGAAEVRAVTENYIHVVRPKMVGGRPIKTALGLLDNRKKKIQAKLTKQFHAGKLKRNDFAVEFWHQVWKTAADDGLLIYERVER